MQTSMHAFVAEPSSLVPECGWSVVFHEGMAGPGKRIADQDATHQWCPGGSVGSVQGTGHPNACSSDMYVPGSGLRREGQGI